MPAPTTTLPPSGLQFSEDFASAGSFLSPVGNSTDCGPRFNCGWGGEVNAGRLNGDWAQDWAGDHSRPPAGSTDGMCGDPNDTSRVVHVNPPAGEPGAPSGSVKDVSQAFYWCANGTGHMMTSVNTEGYVTVWFAPRQIFTNVHRVCWDVNLTDPVGSMWIAVNFLTPDLYQGRTDLGYTTPEFPSNPSSPAGAAPNGISTFNGFRSYTNGEFHGGPGNPGGITDKAGRYQHCVVDNENGILTLTQARPAQNGQPARVISIDTAGAIPNGSIRVEFAHDLYNPDKHQDPPICRDCGPEYTWHWDNIQIG